MKCVVGSQHAVIIPIETPLPILRIPLNEYYLRLRVRLDQVFREREHRSVAQRAELADQLVPLFAALPLAFAVELGVQCFGPERDVAGAGEDYVHVVAGDPEDFEGTLHCREMG